MTVKHGALLEKKIYQVVFAILGARITSAVSASIKKEKKRVKEPAHQQ